jgi:hypothetical protein
MIYARFVLFSPVGGLRLRPFPARRAIERGDSDNHGHADYMSVPDMRALFPSIPDSDVGGVVVGEADRVDLGPAARVQFDPDNRVTWGNGGKAPLLIDPCKRGSTHSMVIGGGGTYKSTAEVTSLLTWRKRPHVRFRPRGTREGSKARALPWTRQGRSPWNHLLGVSGFDLSSLHPITRGRPEGVTRLAVCIIEGRTGWSGVEPQAQETGHGTGYTIYRNGRA